MKLVEMLIHNVELALSDKCLGMIVRCIETGALYLAYLHAFDKYIACLDRASEALLKLTRER